MYTHKSTTQKLIRKLLVFEQGMIRYASSHYWWSSVLVVLLFHFHTLPVKNVLNSLELKEFFPSF